MKCQSCGFESPAEMNFCGKCGCELTASSDLHGNQQSFEEKLAGLEPNLPPLAETILAQKSKVEGKPREVTVMFCRLKEFTRGMQKFGPEETSIVTCIVMRNVHHWEGMRSPTTDNGILAEHELGFVRVKIGGPQLDDPAFSVPGTEFVRPDVGADHLYLTLSQYESDIWVAKLKW